MLQKNPKKYLWKFWKHVDNMILTSQLYRPGTATNDYGQLIQDITIETNSCMKHVRNRSNVVKLREIWDKNSH
jgi:hypothetical protein